MKIASWNVNGLRAIAEKGFLPWLDTHQPDVVCVQETKCQPDQLPAILRQPYGYPYSYWAWSTEKKGYSGVAVYSRTEPLRVQVGLGLPEYDAQGRTIMVEFPAFILVGAYFPSGSAGLHTIPYKLGYCEAFLAACEAWRAGGKPLLFCGDMNIAHTPADLARPKANEGLPGFLPEERAWLDKVVTAGYVDVFRHFYPDAEAAYTWWSYRAGARLKNIGWRIDYFFASRALLPSVTGIEHQTEVLGSDHCPLTVTLNV
jgi:exodeoxyribonuclease-3